MTLILRFWLPFVNISHIRPLELASFSRSSNINRHVSPRVFLKSPGTSLYFRMFTFKASNSPVGIEFCSLKHHRIPPLNRCSVRRDLSFCRKLTQNFHLPDPIGPIIMHVNQCLNLTSALIAPVEMTLSPRNPLIYTGRVQKNYRLSDGAWKSIFCRFCPRVLSLLIHKHRRFSFVSSYRCEPWRCCWNALFGPSL